VRLNALADVMAPVWASQPTSWMRKRAGHRSQWATGAPHWPVWRQTCGPQPHCCFDGVLVQSL